MLSTRHRATNHMTHKQNWLFKIQKVHNTLVRLPNGLHSKVENIGSCNFLNKELHNMLDIPDIKLNLLSVTKLTTYLSCSVIFLAKIVILQDLSIGMVLGTGRESSGLYLIYFIDSNINNLAINQMFVDNCFSAC